MLRLALASLPRILPEPDRDPLAVLRGGIEQQLFDVARVGALARMLENIEAQLADTKLEARDVRRLYRRAELIRELLAGRRRHGAAPCQFCSTSTSRPRLRQ